MIHAPSQPADLGWRRLLLQRVRGYFCSLLADDRVVVRILMVFVAVQLLAAVWDLPGDHGWENDGIAPRGVFSGLSGNLTPGHAHRYPLFHYVLSLLVSLPALALTPFVAGDLSKQALLQAGAGTAVMTGVSFCVKALSIGLSTLSLLGLSAFTRRTVESQLRASELRTHVWAARLTVSFCALNLSFAYYGRTSNLDGPYLAWSALLLERLSLLGHGDLREQARRFGQMGLLGAAAVATKDQAYALVFPLFLVACGHALTQRAYRRIVTLCWVAALGYAVFSGALFNPTGFVARIALLRGTNSQDWKVYQDGWLGLRANVHDIALNLPDWWWPWPVLVLALCGLAVCVVWAVRDRMPMVLLPFVMGLGGVCLFTLVVRRNEHRFMLPAAFVASYYVGVGASALLQAVDGRRRQAVWGGLGLLLAVCGWRNVLLIVTQFNDGRRQVASWLARAPEGTRVETYGLPVYQPHYWLDASPYQVTRLQPLGGDAWAPLRGITDLRARYGDVRLRGPDVLVIPEGFASRYFERALGPGERQSELERKARSDPDATEFMNAAIRDRLAGYRVLFVAGESLPSPFAEWGFSPVRVHGSTGMRTWVLVPES